MATFTWEASLAASEKIHWTVDDLIGGDKKLDFTKSFLPESLARTEGLEFLLPVERRTLNQIRGHEYLVTFGLVEEFILPFVLDHARPELSGDDYRTRALLTFATEEAKHIHLFKRFREEFTKGFGVVCDVIGPPEAVAEEVLSHSPLAVALAILHIEWMTQRHFTDSVKDDGDIDPRFKSLLRHHWMEEAQHAKMDQLMVEALAATMTADEIAGAVDEYLEIGAFLDAGLMQQVELNLDSFQRATGRTLTESEAAAFREAQAGAVRWTYLGSGMTHPRFLETLEKLATGHRAKIEDVAPHFC
ncbi:MAG: diiron oxygenase [Planctomycetota bacterium]